MNFWKQSSTLTKIILIVLLIVIIGFTVLILNRNGIISIGGGSDSSTPEAPGTGTPASTQSSTEALSTPLPGGTPTVAGTPLVTATVDTPVHSLPSADAQIITRLSAGQSAEVSGVSRDGLWWQINIPNEDVAKGWVSNENVIAENITNVPVVDPEIEPTSEATSQPGTGGTVTATTNVNIRSGPGVQFEIVGLLDEGQTAEAIGVIEDGSWWYIQLPGVESDTGWVSNDYVTADNTDGVPIVDEEGNPIPGQLPIPTPSPGSPSLTALVNLNIRSGPGTGYDLIGLLLQGRKAQVVGVSTDSNWWAINIPSADNGRGWVSADYVTTENTDEVPVLDGT